MRDKTKMAVTDSTFTIELIEGEPEDVRDAKLRQVTAVVAAQLVSAVNVGIERKGEMSESRHTPGPWRIQLDDVEEPTQAYINAPAAGDERVATAYRDADARLMAAAPDLLEGCEAMFSIRADCFVTGETSPRLGCVCKTCQSARLAASAIAKAKEGK